MTWLKLSDDFADDCAAHSLTDAAVRTHLEGLLWCMRRGTGGELSDIHIRRCVETADPTTAIAELLAVGFWQRADGGYRILHGMDVQIEPDVLEQRRKNERERQRRKRREDARLAAEAESRDSHVTVTRDVTRDPGQDRTGQVWSESTAFDQAKAPNISTYGNDNDHGMEDRQGGTTESNPSVDDDASRRNGRADWLPAELSRSDTKAEAARLVRELGGSQ